MVELYRVQYNLVSTLFRELLERGLRDRYLWQNLWQLDFLRKEGGRVSAANARVRAFPPGLVRDPGSSTRVPSRQRRTRHVGAT